MIIGIRNYSTIPTFRLAKTQLCLLEEAAIGLCKILPGGPNVTLPDKPRTPSTVVDQVSKKKPNQTYIYRGCTTLTQAHLSDAEDLWPCCCLINHWWGMVGSVKFLLESPEISRFAGSQCDPHRFLQNWVPICGHGNMYMQYFNGKHVFFVNLGFIKITLW